MKAASARKEKMSLSRIEVRWLMSSYCPNRLGASITTITSLTRMQLVRPKDPQKVDDKVIQYNKRYVVVIAVTASSLSANIVSITWERGSFDMYLRHTSNIVEDFIGEKIHSATTRSPPGPEQIA